MTEKEVTIQSDESSEDRQKKTNNIGTKNDEQHLKKDLVQKLPNSPTEIIAMTILGLLGVVALLNPEHLFVIRGIDQDPFLNQVRGIWAILLLFSSIMPTFLTGVYKRHVD